MKLQLNGFLNRAQLINVAWIVRPNVYVPGIPRHKFHPLKSKLNRLLNHPRPPLHYHCLLRDNSKPCLFNNDSFKNLVMRNHITAVPPNTKIGNAFKHYGYSDTTSPAEGRRHIAPPTSIVYCFSDILAITSIQYIILLSAVILLYTSGLGALGFGNQRGFQSLNLAGVPK